MVEPGNEDFSTPVKRTPQEFKFVKLCCDGGVARMTLSRPEHNLLNEAMLREMADGIGFAGERDDIKLIVLDSACKVFCGGNHVRAVNERPLALKAVDGRDADARNQLRVFAVGFFRPAPTGRGACRFR